MQAAVSTKLEIFKFHNVYELSDLIDKMVREELDFDMFNEQYFIKSAASFSKSTLLHQYIATSALRHYRREFRKNGDCIEEEELKDWIFTFRSYGVVPVSVEWTSDGWERSHQWFELNYPAFEELFDKMADEVFNLLFSNRSFLLSFNLLVANTVRELDFPPKALNSKGKIKRRSVPQWLKSAVFHRDKGRCVFCATDLTSLVNTLTDSNYDHIVPLDLDGANDPSNIQLTCEACNKSKGNRNCSTGNLYQPWWTK